MCRICVELEMGKLTSKEARRNLSEIEEELDPDHMEEVEDLIELVEEIGDKE